MKNWLVLALIAGVKIVAGQGWQGDVAMIPTTASVLSFNQGMASLSIQAGSVVAPTPIYLGPCPTAPPLGTLLSRTVFAMGRPMLTLSKTATLTISYFENELPIGTTEASLRIYVVRNGKWTLVGGTVNAAANTVSTSLTKAGTYALLAATSNTSNSNSLFVQATVGPTLINGDSPLPSNEWISVDTSGVLLGQGTDSQVFGRRVDRPNHSVVSPAGNALFFGQPQSLTTAMELYVANADGSHPARITNLGAQLIGDGAASGDGRLITFTAFIGGVWKLFKGGADGSALAEVQGSIPTQLEAGPPVAINPAGTQIAVAANNVVSIYNAATNALIRQIGFNSNATGVLGIAFNATGATLAVTTDTGLYTVAALSGSPVTRHTAQGFRGPVCWHPDGTMIAAAVFNGVDILRLTPKTWYLNAIPQTSNTLYRLHWR